MRTIFAAKAHGVAGFWFGHHLFIALAIQIAYNIIKAVVHAAQADITVGQHDIVVEIFHAAAGPGSIGVLDAVPAVPHVHEFRLEYGLPAEVASAIPHLTHRESTVKTMCHCGMHLGAHAHYLKILYLMRIVSHPFAKTHIARSDGVFGQELTVRQVEGKSAVGLARIGYVGYAFYVVDAHANARGKHAHGMTALMRIQNHVRAAAVQPGLHKTRERDAYLLRYGF